MQRTVFAAVLMCVGCGHTGAPPPAPPPAEVRPLPSTVRPTPVPLTFSVQLVDGKTRAIMAGATATVTSKRGSWEGRADAEGGVHVPADIVDDTMTVRVKGFRPATVNRNTGRRPKRVVTLRLVPE